MKKAFFFLIVLNTFAISSCKKIDDNSEQIIHPPAEKKTYDVLIHISLGGTSATTSVTLPDTDISHNHTITNIPDGYEQHVTGKSGDELIIDGTRTGTGYTSISIEIYLDGTFYVSDGNNNSSGSCSASIHTTLP
jgi:hypothetical protein